MKSFVEKFLRVIPAPFCSESSQTICVNQIIFSNRKRLKPEQCYFYKKNLSNYFVVTYRTTCIGLRLLYDPVDNNLLLYIRWRETNEKAKT